MKQCKKCGRGVADGARFNRDAHKKDGLRGVCVTCDNAQRSRNYRRATRTEAVVEAVLEGSVHVPPEVGWAAIKDALKTKSEKEAEQARKRQQERAAEKEADRRRRLASDYEPLGADNYEKPQRDDGYQSQKCDACKGSGLRIGLKCSKCRGTGRYGFDPDADRQKKQEYSKRMGQFSDMLRTGASPQESKLGSYISSLAEDERRFINRRLARSISLAAARDELGLRRFVQAANEWFSGKIVPIGYAKKFNPAFKPEKRTVNILLSDLHFGSELSGRDNPEVYTAVQEARRFEKIVREVCDYKPQYREQTKLNVLLNGDVIDGMLLHDLRDGAPLTEQFVRFWRYLSAALGTWAAAFPRVEVHCQPGNHGRNKLRHPGRATSSKWDGEEWKAYYALSRMCTNLPNVQFNLPTLPYCSIDLHGAKMLLSHGDTEIDLNDPDRGAESNAAALNTVNATKLYGEVFDVFAFGHFHKGRVQKFKNFVALFNAALIPPNGHGRTSGYINEACGQWLFESVEGYPVGDLRFLDVGPAQDTDEKLGKIVKPFTLEESLAEGAN